MAKKETLQENITQIQFADMLEKYNEPILWSGPLFYVCFVSNLMKLPRLNTNVFVCQ